MRVRVPPSAPPHFNLKIIENCIKMTKILKIFVLYRFPAFFYEKGDKKGINFFSKKRLAFSQSKGEVFSRTFLSYFPGFSGSLFDQFP